MRNLFLRWPCVAVALGLAGLLAVGPAGAAPLPSQISPRLASPEAAAALERLAALGFDSGEAQRRLAGAGDLDVSQLRMDGGFPHLAENPVDESSREQKRDNPAPYGAKGQQCASGLAGQIADAELGQVAQCCQYAKLHGVSG